MTRTIGSIQPRVRTTLLFAVLASTALSAVNCAYYADPRAEVIVTTSRKDAGIYLVPMDVQTPKPPTRSAMEKFMVGTTSSRDGIWVHHGRYWLILESNGVWSQPVEFEVRLDYLNKVHVEF